MYSPKINNAITKFNNPLNTVDIIVTDELKKKDESQVMTKKSETMTQKSQVVTKNSSGEWNF